MASPTSSSSVVQEMKAVFTAIKEGSIGQEPLKISTHSGRKYEVCYVRETGPDVWMSTRGGLVRGYFRCPDCPAESDLPGGNWYQVTLKNGASPEPVVRLFEILHKFESHPKTLEDLATFEKCISVFGSVIPASEAASSSKVICFDLPAMQKKAEAYVNLNLFELCGTKVKMPYKTDQDALLKKIQNILLDATFQSNPKKYLDEWAIKREYKPITGQIQDDFARQFFDTHFEYSNR